MSLQTAVDYAYNEMMDFMQDNDMDPQTHLCVRKSTNGENIPSECEATEEFERNEAGMGEAGITAGATHCTYSWTPSPGGTGGAVWHYSEEDGWKFCQAYE